MRNKSFEVGYQCEIGRPVPSHAGHVLAIAIPTKRDYLAGPEIRQLLGLSSSQWLCPDANNSVLGVHVFDGPTVRRPSDRRPVSHCIREDFHWLSARNIDDRDLPKGAGPLV